MFFIAAILSLEVLCFSCTVFLQLQRKRKFQKNSYGSIWINFALYIYLVCRFVYTCRIIFWVALQLYMWYVPGVTVMVVEKCKIMLLNAVANWLDSLWLKRFCLNGREHVKECVRERMVETSLLMTSACFGFMGILNIMRQ